MEYTIETGDEANLKDLLKKFSRLDANTVLYNWRHADRRGHLLILHSAAMGHAVVSIVPPDKFNFTDHRIPQKYQLSWLGQHIKPKTMYVFGNKVALSSIIEPDDEADADPSPDHLTPDPFKMEEPAHGRAESAVGEPDPTVSAGDIGATTGKRAAANPRAKTRNPRAKPTGNRKRG